MYSPSGAHIASGSDDQTIRIWNAHTGQPVGHPFEGHKDLVHSVAYSPSGAYIVSGSSDNTLRIWDAQTGLPIGQPLEGHTGLVRSVAYSPNGAHIVSGSEDQTIRIWDACTGQPIGQPFQNTAGPIYSVTYSLDSAYILSSSSDKTVSIWDTFTGQPVDQPFKSHTDLANSNAHIERPAELTVNYPNPACLNVYPPENTDVLPEADHQAELLEAVSDVAIHELPTPNAALLPEDWTLNGEGWVVNANQDRLIWIPPYARDTVLNKFAIPEEKIDLDFHDAKLGENWQYCFNPSPVP
ncbi:POC1 centriolar protein A [Ceratobasidium sp. 394]|nr:POC1 centriolar protein A [Ceratobasidium sp. 394]